MLIINVDKLLTSEPAKDEQTIEIILPNVLMEAERQVDEQVIERIEHAEAVEDRSEQLRESLTWDLINQERELRVHRAKESNKYLPMMDEGATSDELAAHYRRIESISADMRQVYKSREHVQKFGRLPEQGTAGGTIDMGNILALKELRRSLINRRNKMKTKIKLAEAKSSDPSTALRVVELQAKLDKLNVEYIDVGERIKVLNRG